MDERTMRWLVISGVVLVILIALAASAFAFTGRPVFCNSCHIIKPLYSSWKKSIHPREATCLDCHADPGFIGEIKAHISGARYLFYTVFKKTDPKNIRATVPNNRCLQCHEVSKLNKKFNKHGVHIEGGATCTRCHDDFLHKINNKGQPLKKPKSNCKECHPKGIPD